MQIADAFPHTMIPAGCIHGNRRRRDRSRDKPRLIERMDRHVEDQRVVHRVAEAAEMRADEEVGVHRSDRADRFRSDQLA